MTRRTWFFLGLSGSAGCRRGGLPRLNVWNWSQYVGPDTIPNFEREFGVRVRYGTYESNEEMLVRVLGGNSGWDIVFPTSILIPPMREMGLLAKVNHASLRNLGQLDDSFRNPVWDPQLEWGVPYMWNSSGVCYQKHLQIDSWADLWRSELRGRIVMLDDPFDVFAACLLKLGLSINSGNAGELREAQKQAIEQKPLVRAYLNDVRDQLVAGDVLAAHIWSITAQQAMDESPNLAFCFPSEGFPLYPDVAVILRESTRSELAHKFLDYLLRPEVAAGIVRGARTGTVNRGAMQLLGPDLLSKQALYPPAGILERGEWALTSSPAIHRLRDRLWTEIKAA